LEQAELKKHLKKIGIIGALFAPALLFYLLNLRGALVFYALMLSVILVLMVLIQSGRGGGLASLGGLDTDSLFGTHSATPISKATYVIGALLIVTCMLAARLGTIKREGVGYDSRAGERARIAAARRRRLRRHRAFRKASNLWKKPRCAMHPNKGKNVLHRVSPSLYPVDSWLL